MSDKTNSCDIGHEEIEYDGADCPLCAVILERDDIKERLDVSRMTITAQDAELDAVREKLADLTGSRE
jgi:hypothetical protein